MSCSSVGRVPCVEVVGSNPTMTAKLSENGAESIGG